MNSLVWATEKKKEGRMGGKKGGGRKKKEKEGVGWGKGISFLPSCQYLLVIGAEATGKVYPTAPLINETNN